MARPNDMHIRQEEDIMYCICGHICTAHNADGACKVSQCSCETFQVARESQGWFPRYELTNRGKAKA